MDDWECIEDFCGTDGVGRVQYWADWSPSRKAVVFGGDWRMVKPMPAEKKPTDSEVQAWAEKYDMDVD